jgi:hypothetical protein
MKNNGKIVYLSTMHMPPNVITFRDYFCQQSAAQGGK